MNTIKENKDITKTEARFIQYSKLVMGFIFGGVVIALLVMIMLKLDCLCN